MVDICFSLLVPPLPWNRFWSDNSCPVFTFIVSIYIPFAFTFFVIPLFVLAIFERISFSCPPESLAPLRDVLQTPLRPLLVRLPRSPPLARLRPENARPPHDVILLWTFLTNQTLLPRPGETRDSDSRPPPRRLLPPPAVVLGTAQLCPSPGESVGISGKWITALTHVSPSRPTEEPSRTQTSPPPPRRRSTRNGKVSQGNVTGRASNNCLNMFLTDSHQQNVRPHNHPLHEGRKNALHAMPMRL